MIFSLKLHLFQFVIGQEEKLEIYVKDFGEDLLYKYQLGRKYFIQETQVIVRFLNKLAKFLRRLI